MRSAPLIEIISRLEGLDVDDGARTAFRAMVLEVSARHGVQGIERAEQIAFVRRLLALRVSRPTIRDRLMALYGVSRRQAYRLIHDEL
jgi:hypothetical protein